MLWVILAGLSYRDSQLRITRKTSPLMFTTSDITSSVSLTLSLMRAKLNHCKIEITSFKEPALPLMTSWRKKQELREALERKPLNGSLTLGKSICQKAKLRTPDCSKSLTVLKNSCSTSITPLLNSSGLLSTIRTEKFLTGCLLCPQTILIPLPSLRNRTAGLTRKSLEFRHRLILSHNSSSRLLILSTLKLQANLTMTL